MTLLLKQSVQCVLIAVGYTLFVPFLIVGLIAAFIMWCFDAPLVTEGRE